MKNQKITQSTVSAPSLLNPKDFGLATDMDANKLGSPRNFAVAVRVLLQNWRQGTVACKNRSQVSGSNKKPWKQKGTGRARAGAVTSPLWRGGGIIFGPQARVRKLRVSRKLWHVVARELLEVMLAQQRLFIVDWDLTGDNPSTKQVHAMLKAHGLVGKQTNIFLGQQDDKLFASCVNINTVRIVYMDAPNAYDLSDAHYWVVFKKDMDLFKQMVAQWT